MTPEVKIMPGQLPPFWDRNVIFFCNIHSIFYDNKEETSELLKQITGLQSYGGRVISILNRLFRGGPNKILVETAPEPSLLDYLSGDLRLSLPAFDVLDNRGYRELVGEAPGQGRRRDRSDRRSIEKPARVVGGRLCHRRRSRRGRGQIKQADDQHAGGKQERK
jgi:hypothetical protein